MHCNKNTELTSFGFPSPSLQGRKKQDKSEPAMMVCKMSQSIINPYILPTKLASEESKSPPMGLIGWAAAAGAIVGVIAGAIAGTIVNPAMGTIPGVNGVLAAAMGVPPVL